MPTGKDLLSLAEKHIGEKYLNVCIPKDNPNWVGPWDCAEFASWVSFQITRTLYGCLNDSQDPSTADAYSGAWAHDYENGKFTQATQKDANEMSGIILIRKPPIGNSMGHIAISDGIGGTVEAAGINLGVRRGKIDGRVWDYFAQIPQVNYKRVSEAVPQKPLPYILRLTDPPMTGPIVKRIQKALKTYGINPGTIDGVYGSHTIAAVYAFQKSNKLVADGMVGPLTAKKLGVAWISA